MCRPIDRFWPSIERVEYGRRHAQALVLVVTPPELSKCLVRVARQRRQLIKKREVEFAFWLRLRAPHVPGRHLHLVQRGRVADEVAGDEPEAAKGREGNAELLLVRFAAAASPPRVGRCQKLRPRQIELIEADIEPSPPDVIDLRV